MNSQSQETTPIVRLDRVCKSFHSTQVLTNVTLDVPQGQVVCIIGPSGAGKSTLLRCINHLETIDSGTILFEGVPVYRYQRNGKVVVDPQKRVEQVRGQIGMVFQAFNLFPHLTAIGNIIEAPVHVRGASPSAAREQAMALLSSPSESA